MSRARRVALLRVLALLPGVGLALGCQSPPARNWSDTTDFAALRAEYGARDDFAAVCEEGRPFEELAAQAQAKDWAGIIDTSEPWLQSCPVDIDVHFIRAVALKESGQAEESDLHLAWYKGLVESVLASGDGRSAKTAWVVISVQEEYAILRGLRARPLSQKLLDGQIDVLEVERRDGQRATVYFNPKAHLHRLKQQREQAGAKSP